MKKKQLVQLTTPSCMCFSLGQSLYFGMQQKRFICTSCFIMENIGKPCAQGWRFDNIYCFIKGILKCAVVKRHSDC